MQDWNDIELAQAYAQQNSEEAFTTLVSRYVNLVYSAALRCVGDPLQAEEVTQAVFIILAKKAGGFRQGTSLSGWLYQTARWTAANLLRTEHRRMHREQEAYMQSLALETDPEAWQHIAPHLEEAMGKLGDKDRHAIILRYFEGQDLKAVAGALGTSQDAAKMRVGRAVEKLRAFFGKRGLTLSAALLGAALSANSIQAAPAGLVATATAVAVKGSLGTATTLTLVKQTLNMMTWTKIKLALGLSAAMLATGGAITISLAGGSPTPADIVQKSKAAYESLTSLTASGRVVGELGGATMNTIFSLKLSRPYLYLVEWAGSTPGALSGAVWNAGNGDYLTLDGTKSTRQKDQQTAFASASGVSSGAAATQPAAFYWPTAKNGFSMGSGPFTLFRPTNIVQLANEKIGTTDCYVLSATLNGMKQTLWIGRTDLLVHQIEKTAVGPITVPGKVPNAALQQNLANLSAQGYKTTETYDTITVNQSIPASDFDHPMP